MRKTITATIAATRTAGRFDRTVELSARELSLLEMLVSHAGQVRSREQILSGVWGCENDPQQRRRGLRPQPASQTER